MRMYEADASTSGSADVNTPPPNDENQTGQKSEESTQEKNFKALRETNNRLTKELEAIKAKELEAQKKKLEEEGKLQELLALANTEKSELQNQLTNISRQSQIQKELAKSGLSSSLADLILPSVLAQAKYQDDGSAVNLQDIIEGIKTTSPQLFAAQPAVPAGTSTGVGATQSGESSKPMTQEKALEILNSGNNSEILRLNKEIQAALNQ